MKSNYKIVNDYVIIYIKKKSIDKLFEVYIDLEDLEKVKKYSWHVQYARTNDEYYVSATNYLGMFNGKPKYQILQLHRYVMDVIDDDRYEVDHKNYKPLDNRKKNLRLTIHNKNLKHRNGKNSNNKSGYRNVSYDKGKGLWAVQLIVDGKNTKIGFFDDVHEAGRFAEEKRKELYGMYAGKD
jgi:hypothetical protein